MDSETSSLIDKREHGFFIIDDEVITKFELTPHQFAVYATIVMHSNKRTKVSWPGVDTIAKESGVKRSTVITSIKRLRELGLIAVKRRSRSSIYTINNVKKLCE